MGPSSLKLNLLKTGFRFAGALAPEWTGRRVANFFCRTQRFDRPPREVEALKGARRRELACGLIAYEWEADPQAPIALLVHGWNGRGSQMAAFAKPLRARGYRVIAVDGPGHGESPGLDTDAHRFSNALVSACEELGGAEVVVAHSFGGACAVWAVEKGARVRKLVLIAIPSSYQGVMDQFAISFGMPKRLKQAFDQELKSRAGVQGDLPEIGEMGRKHPHPTLIIHDREDREVGFRHAERIQSLWPGVEIFETRGQGHRRVLRNAAVLEKVTEFVTKGSNL